LRLTIAFAWFTLCEVDLQYAMPLGEPSVSAVKAHPGDCGDGTGREGNLPGAV
jgi:hypothetical protein